MSIISELSLFAKEGQFPVPPGPSETGRVEGPRPTALPVRRRFWSHGATPWHSTPSRRGQRWVLERWDRAESSSRASAWDGRPRRTLGWPFPSQDLVRPAGGRRPRTLSKEWVGFPHSFLPSHLAFTCGFQYTGQPCFSFVTRKQREPESEGLAWVKGEKARAV